MRARRRSRKTDPTKRSTCTSVLWERVASRKVQRTLGQLRRRTHTVDLKRGRGTINLLARTVPDHDVWLCGPRASSRSDHLDDLMRLRLLIRGRIAGVEGAELGRVVD